MSKQFDAKQLDLMSMQAFGRKRSTCLKENTCVVCGSDVKGFTCESTEEEYKMTAVCETCQYRLNKYQDDDEHPQQELWC